MAPLRRVRSSVLALLAPLALACSAAPAPEARVPSPEPGQVLVPIRRSPPPFAEPPVTPPPAEPPPAEPAPPPSLPPAPPHQCGDVDCPTGTHCVQRIVAACPVCDGGRLESRCVPDVQLPREDCPASWDCMPRILLPGEPAPGPCPPPELSARCPDMPITY